MAKRDEERDQIWISGLGWHVIRRTMGRYGGSAGEDSIAEKLCLVPAEYDKSSSLTRSRAAEMVYGSSQVGEI